jgi:hypothetical protein
LKIEHRTLKIELRTLKMNLELGTQHNSSAIAQNNVKKGQPLSTYK